MARFNHKTSLGKEAEGKAQHYRNRNLLVAGGQKAWIQVPAGGSGTSHLSSLPSGKLSFEIMHSFYKPVWLKQESDVAEE